MQPWLLTIPFALACGAWGVRLVIVWAPKTFGDVSSLYSGPALLASFWLPYAMLALSMILELRHFALRSRPARMWAYSLVLISNSFAPMVYMLWFAKRNFGVVPEGALSMYASLFGLLVPLASSAVVTFLCFFKDRSSPVAGRGLPAGFAILGSVENCLLAGGILLSI